MEIAILIVHVLAALSLIGLVLLQHGKGADVGAAFGSGASGSLFGASGSANFMSRTTAILAAVFFLTSLGLTLVSNRGTVDRGVMANRPVQEQSQPAKAPEVPTPTPVPAAPAPKSGPSEKGSKAGEVPK